MKEVNYEVRLNRKHAEEFFLVKRISNSLKPAKIQDLGEMVFVHPGGREYIMVIEFSEN